MAQIKNELHHLAFVFRLVLVIENLYFSQARTPLRVETTLCQDPYGLEPEISQGSFFVSSVLIEHQQFLSQMLIVHLAAFILALAKVKRPKGRSPVFYYVFVSSMYSDKVSRKDYILAPIYIELTDTLGLNLLCSHISTFLTVSFATWR